MAKSARPVLVVGSLNMDLVVRCERLPQPGQTIIGSGFFTAPGGKGANQAVAAARLGARVGMAGCVGRDAFGDTLRRGLHEAHVETGDVATVDGPTGTALITVDAAGANTIVVASGANMACDAALAEHAIARAGGPGILLLQHEIPPATNAAAIRAARAAGWFVILNPAPAQAVPPDLLPLIDLLAPNETEAAAILGRSLDGRDASLAAARMLVAAGAPAVLLTMGGEGALYCEAPHSDAPAAWHCPVVPVRPVDTTAAGDAYIGALAAALAEGQPITDGLGFAAAAAAFSVTRLGAQPSLPTRDELASFLRAHAMPVAHRLAA